MFPRGRAVRRSHAEGRTLTRAGSGSRVRGGREHRHSSVTDGVSSLSVLPEQPWGCSAGLLVPEHKRRMLHFFISFNCYKFTFKKIML